jgi:glycosyltransferase involved in cell wall biosynthesis
MGSPYLCGVTLPSRWNVWRWSAHYITQRAAAIESDWSNVRILHLPGTFFPRGKGGKEVFVNNLIKHLPEHEHVVVIHGSETSYIFQGVPVHVLPHPTISDRRYSYFSLVYDDLPGFGAALDEYNPDIVHFHDFCAGASLSHLRMCKEKKLRTLVTYHTPGTSCLQRGLTFKGIEPCDGRIDLTRCTVCRYSSRGWGAIARVASLIEPNFDKTGKVFLRRSTSLYYRSWCEFFQKVDAVQVHAPWVEKLLVANDVPSEKIHAIEMGGHPTVSMTSPRPARDNKVLKLGFVGRCAHIKGIHLLIDAVNKIPLHYELEVHFLGPHWEEEFGRQLLARIAGNSRFKTPRYVPPENIVAELRSMDVCVIPSLWPETGPLSLFDAFAAQLPIIGTNLAGIADRVKDGESGLLFKWGDSEDLARKIRQVLDNRELLNQFRRAIPPNHTFAEMATNIGRLYCKMTY